MLLSKLSKTQVYTESPVRSDATQGIFSRRNYWVVSLNGSIFVTVNQYANTFSHYSSQPKADAPNTAALAFMRLLTRNFALPRKIFITVWS